MNEYKSSLVAQAPEPAAPPRVTRWRWKVGLAFLLGLLSLFLTFFVVEVFGDYALFIGLGAYFLATQFLLSRGNPQAVCKGWPIIMALNFTLLCNAVIALTIEPNKGAALEMLWLALLALACSCAGAALAARVARRRRAVISL